ncbi:MAG: hypothetical protein VB137_15940 [Burkholderia sp.]
MVFELASKQLDLGGIRGRRALQGEIAPDERQRLAHQRRGGDLCIAHLLAQYRVAAREPAPRHRAARASRQ